jgi:hypothetical protein
MRRSLLPLLCSAALVGAGVASAAASSPVVLGDVEGSVLVNQGERFVSVRGEVRVSAGDRVLGMTGASATLTWSDGCSVALPAESMVTIGAVSPCAGAVLEVEDVGAVVAQADTSEGSRVARTDPDSYTWLIIGGVAVAVVAAASGGSGSSPPPPPPTSP